MDKYEYKLKTEQMLELMEDGSYKKAAEIADAIDWKRVRNAAMLTNVSDIYEKNKEYEKSYNVLNLAYHRAEGSRKIISKLCTLALKTGNVDEAIDFYDDFMQIAPKDPNQYILRYQILRAQRAPIEQQIEALEEYKKSEYIEEWAYELAKLYQEAGMTAECLEECDDLILWFSEGQYVYKAMELKMQYKPLTPSQQEKYDKRYEKLSAETEEMPDIATYAGEAEQEEDANAEDVVDDTADNEDVRTADIVNMEDTTDADGVEVSVADTESENDSAAVEITEENTTAEEVTGDTAQEAQAEAEDTAAEAAAEETADEGTDAEEKPKKLFGRKKEKKDKKDEKIEELTDQIKRQMAEFDNFRKRTEKEKASMYVIGAREIVEKILPVVDNFERGLAAAADRADDPFVDGMNPGLPRAVPIPAPLPPSLLPSVSP